MDAFDALEQQFQEMDYQRYIADTQQKKAEVLAGKTVRRPDPNQPAFSQQADDLRQQKALAKSDAVQASEPIDPFDALEAIHQASQSKPKPTVKSTKLTVLPETSLNPEGFTPTPRGHSAMERVAKPIIEAVPGLATGLDYLAMPGDYLRGALSGQPGERVDPYTFMGAGPDDDVSHLQGAIRGAAGMLVDPLIALGPLAGGITRGMRAAPRAPVIPPSIPAGEVDMRIASSPSVVSGTPDYPIPGPKVEETGRIIAQQAEIPAEFPNEQYTLFNPEPVAPNTRILQPDEQLGVGETALRPQVLHKPGFPQPETIPNPLNLEGKGFDPSTIEYPGLKPSVKESEIPNFTEEFLRNTIKHKAKIVDNLLPQKDYRVTLQTSPKGSVSVREAEADSGLRYNHISHAPSDIPLVFPGWPSRITNATLDTLNSMGPAGQNISKAIDSVLSNRAVLTSNDTLQTTMKLREIAGTRGQASRIIEGFRELTHGENAFIWGTHRYFNLSELEVEQIYNYMYTNGRMIPASTKARAFGDALWEGMLRGPSQAAHDSGLKLYNPLTGKHEPYGAVGMYMPQIPEKAVSISGISDTHLELLYNKQGGAIGTGKSFPMWKSQLQRIISQGGELREVKAAEAGNIFEAGARYDIASKRYKGLEVTRLLDLEALGGSPYQWAKKFGYGTDVFRNAFRANSSGYLRTEWARVLPQIERDMAYIAERGGTDMTEWAAKAINRAQGLNTGIDESRIMRSLVKGVRDFNNITMLQFGGLGSASQLGYALGRAPITRSLMGSVDFVVGHNRKLVEESGAVYPSVLNEMTQPEGALSIASSGALRSYGVTAADKWSRYLGGHIGVRYADFLEKSLLKYPQKERIHKLVEEMGGDVNIILKEGKIPQEMRLAIIQKYANYAAGVADARGLPLIATSETAYARLANQYRSFMFSNNAELARLWKNAPTTYDAITRIATVVAGTGATAATTGAIIEYLRNAFTEHEGSPFVNKKLSKIVGDDGSAFVIQTLAYGLGALYGSLILSALDDKWKLVGGLALGPTGGLIAGASEDVVDSIIYGPGWKSLRTASRRTPVLGPVLAPLVRENVLEDQRIERKNEQLRRALMPQSGFDNEP
jgi:hypothetical protein